MSRPVPLALFAAAPLALAAPAAGQCELDHLTDGGLNSQLGHALATDGSTLVVGARFDATAATGAGAVYVYERTPAGWELVDVLTASDAEAGDSFGYSVALDGDRLVVGANLADGLEVEAGAAYVFDRVGGTWNESAKLEPAAPVPKERYGESCVVDGDTVLVGMHVADDVADAAGRAYHYELSPGGWSLLDVLLPTDSHLHDHFGLSFALDGDRLLVGARNDDEGGEDAGAAYWFEREGGGTWVEVATLTSPGVPGNARLGTSVDLLGDFLLAGAPGGGPQQQGALHVFERTDQGFVEHPPLVPSVAQPFDGTGQAVALTPHGAFGGAPLSNATAGRSGAVHVLGSPAAPSLALAGAPPSASIGAGAVQQLALAGCGGLAGSVYLVLGSASGTAGGPSADGVTLPLAIDPYLLHTLTAPNGPPLTGGLGLLSPGGAGAASFALPPGFDPALAGLTLHHAAVVIDGTGVVAASFPVALELLP